MKTDLLLQHAKALKLYGLINHWDEVKENSWVEQLISWEEDYRSTKSLDNRLRGARIGRFKPLTQFDWNWPKHCEREVIERWMDLDFIKDATNLILCGPNGVGKTTIARNVAYQSIDRKSVV